MVDLREYKPLFVICVLILLLILAVYVISYFWPKYEERFFELGLLGRNGMAEDYYPGNSSSVEVGAKVTWFIYIHNHMGSVENVSIRIKLLNSTMEAPDDRAHEPAPYPYLMEIPLGLAVDETLQVPFSWRVSDVSVDNDSVVVEGLVANNATFPIDVSSVYGQRFRMVFELWVYDRSSDDYRFGWDSGKGFYSVSLYMWFNLTVPTVI